MTHNYLSAAALLLDREISQVDLSEWTKIISGKTQEVESGLRSSVVFRIGSEWLALPTSAFQEATEPSRIHKLPNRKSGMLRGLVNVRGELMLCASLEVLLGMKEPSDTGPTPLRTGQERLLVCNYKGDHLAFPATEVIGIHNYLPDDVRNVPATLAHAVSCTVGVLHWKDKTIGLLDTELLFQMLSKGLE